MPEVSAEEVVRQASDDMLQLIESGRSYVDDDPERFYNEVEALLNPIVDFDRFARNVMGPHWKRATEDQQQRFIHSFKWGLLRTYAVALTEFSDGEVLVLEPDRPPRNPARRNVKMEIKTSGGDVYPIVYSMAADAGEWRLRNIIIGGVNIGLTYRSQFASAVKDPKYGGDMDKVIDAWDRHLAESREAEEEAAATEDAADVADRAG